MVPCAIVQPLKGKHFFLFFRKSGGKNTSSEDSHVTVIYTFIAVIVMMIVIIMYKCFCRRQGNNHTEISNYSPPEGGRSDTLQFKQL